MIRKLISFVLYIFLKIKWFIVAHIKACFIPMDPIIEAPEWITIANMKETLPEFGQARVRCAQALHAMFVFPILVEILYVLDSVWVMYSHEFDFFNNPMPELLSHKMFPDMFKYFRDMIVWVVVTACLINYYALWKRDFLNENFVMYVVKNDAQDDGENDDCCLIVDGKVWDKQNGAKIISLWRKNKVQLRYMVAFLYFVISSYLNLHYLAKPLTGWKHYLVFVLYYQEFLWYGSNLVVFMFLQFFIATNYLLIRQKFIIAKQNELLFLIKKRHNRFYADWHKYLELNSQLAYLCNEVRAYNRFWGVILTILFCSDMLMISIFTYCCMYFSNYSFGQIFYFAFYMVQLSTMVLAVIFRCSKVDANNDQCYMLNMRVCILFQLMYRNVTPRQLANIHKIATNRNFSKSCFRLSNGYRLDSSAFNMAVYIETSLFFMLVRRSNSV